MLLWFVVVQPIIKVFLFYTLFSFDCKVDLFLLPKIYEVVLELAKGYPNL